VFVCVVIIIIIIQKCTFAIVFYSLRL